MEQPERGTRVSTPALPPVCTILPSERVSGAKCRECTQAPEGPLAQRREIREIIDRTAKGRAAYASLGLRGGAGRCRCPAPAHCAPHGRQRKAWTLGQASPLRARSALARDELENRGRVCDLISAPVRSSPSPGDIPFPGLLSSAAITTWSGDKTPRTWAPAPQEQLLARPPSTTSRYARVGSDHRCGAHAAHRRGTASAGASWCRRLWVCASVANGRRQVTFLLPSCNLR